jgi:hypothetical protein
VTDRTPPAFAAVAVAGFVSMTSIMSDGAKTSIALPLK